MKDRLLNFCRNDVELLKNSKLVADVIRKLAEDWLDMEEYIMLLHGQKCLKDGKENRE